MKIQTDKLINPAELRKYAEKELSAQSNELMDPLMTDEKRLLHELQVHQIELEMQNEALQEALIKANEEQSKTDRISSLLTTLIDIAFDGYWIVNLTGNLCQVNKAYATLTGYSVDELLTMHISQLEAKETSEQIKAHIAKVIEQGHDLFETLHRHKNGQIIDMEVSAAYLPVLQQICVFCRLKQR